MLREMDFDYDLALHRVSRAIDRVLHAPGPLGAGVVAGVLELSSPDLMALPKGETRDLFESIFVAMKRVNSNTISEANAEAVIQLIFALRARMEDERRELRRQARLLEEAP
jgi:hypothetical protein